MSVSLSQLLEESLQIAWEYLERTGKLGDGAEASRFLSETIEVLIRRGERSRLVLSNRAISAYQGFRKDPGAASSTGRENLSDSVFKPIDGKPETIECERGDMTETDSELADRLGRQHSVSPAAVQVVMTALKSGGGRMAQFSHADFGGMSQWSPGMSMVGDMFNKQLQSKLDALCTDIVAHLDASSRDDGGIHTSPCEVSYRSISASRDWWPSGLGNPSAVGAQNDLRYAVFPEPRRLALDDHGTVSVYNTGDHRIFGVAQAQSGDQTLTFTSQDGLVRLSDLHTISG